MEQFEKLNLDELLKLIKSFYVTLIAGWDEEPDGLAFTIIGWEIYRGNNVIIISDRMECISLKERLASSLSHVAFNEYLFNKLTMKELSQSLKFKEDVLLEKVTILNSDCFKETTLEEVCEKSIQNSAAEAILLDLEAFQRRIPRRDLTVIKKFALEHQKHFLVMLHGGTHGFALFQLKKLVNDEVQLFLLNYNFTSHNLSYYGGTQDGRESTIVSNRENFYFEE